MQEAQAMEQVARRRLRASSELGGLVLLLVGCGLVLAGVHLTQLSIQDDLQRELDASWAAQETSWSALRDAREAGPLELADIVVFENRAANAHDSAVAGAAGGWLAVSSAWGAVAMSLGVALSVTGCQVLFARLGKPRQASEEILRDVALAETRGEP